jgi:cation-transporting ATPase 13A3/4/5
MQGSDMTDWEYLYVDLFIVFPLSILMNYTRPSDELSKNTPHSALISIPIMLSVITHAALVLLVQIGILCFLVYGNNPWFIPAEELNPDNLDDLSVSGSYENTVKICAAMCC